MGDWDASGARNSDRAGDARDDEIRHMVGGEVERLFAATSKDEGVTAFKAYDTSVCAGLMNELCVDVILAPPAPTGSFANIDEAAFRRAVLEQRGVGERIHQDDVGFLETTHGANRDEFRVARAGADECHATRLEKGHDVLPLRN